MSRCVESSVHVESGARYVMHRPSRVTGYRDRPVTHDRRFAGDSTIRPLMDLPIVVSIHVCTNINFHSNGRTDERRHRSSIRSSVRPSVRSSVRLSLNPYICTAVRPSFRALVPSSYRAFVRAFIRPTVHSSVGMMRSLDAQFRQDSPRILQKNYIDT